MTQVDLEMLRDLMDSAAQRGLVLLRANWEGFSVEFAASEPQPKAEVRFCTPPPQPVDPALKRDTPVLQPTGYETLFGGRPPTFARKAD